MKDLFKERQEKINEYLNHRHKLPLSIKKDIPDNKFIKCPSCGSILFKDELIKEENVCPKCHFHYYISPYDRIKVLVDSFFSINDDVVSLDNGFPGYKEKLDKAYKESNLKEGIVTGVAKIKDISFCLGIMDSKFMMGSMGYALGEKVCLLIDYALKNKLPVVIFTSSGGARMQEEIISLMQMAKTTAQVAKLKQALLPYIVVITNPTYGGVSASFASLGDIIIAEPGASFGFAGKRVIASTIKEELPTDFQSAETALKQGLIDMIKNRNELKKTLYDLMDYMR